MQEVAILIVDDDNDTIDIITTALKPMGITTYWTHTGQEALQLTPVLQPNLIIMDLLLPAELKGWEVIARLKQDPINRHIPVLAITGGSPDSLQKARAAGCDGTVQKPFQMRELRRMVEKFIGSNFVTNSA